MCAVIHVSGCLNPRCCQPALRVHRGFQRNQAIPLALVREIEYWRQAAEGWFHLAIRRRPGRKEGPRKVLDARKKR